MLVNIILGMKFLDEHYLSPESTHDYIKHNNMPFGQLKKGIHNLNEDEK